MRVDLVVNPAAARGGSGARATQAASELRSRGADVIVHVPTSRIDSMAILAQLGGTSERVVVVGGDGMVHLAVNALAATETVLGIVSAGTGNDAVSGLRLPTDIAEACNAALAPPVVVDLIEGDGLLAITIATFGFSVAVNVRAEKMRWPKGGARYTAASLAEMRRLPNHELSITVDGSVYEVDAHLVAVANTAYFGGGMRVAPDADPTDGQLDVVIIGPMSRPMFAALLPTVFNGRHVNTRYVQVVRGAEVTVTRGVTEVHADGERFGSTPITFRARPAALLVAGALAPVD